MKYSFISELFKAGADSADNVYSFFTNSYINYNYYNNRIIR